MDDREKVIEAARLLALGEAKLKETEYRDQETLQEYGEMYNYNHERATEINQAQYRQRLRAMKGDRAFMEVLKSEGLTPEQYIELESRNPNAFPETYREGMKNLVKRVKGGTPKGDPFFAPGADNMTKPSPQNVKKARQIASKKTGDMDAVLNALMGFDD